MAVLINKIFGTSVKFSENVETSLLRNKTCFKNMEKTLNISKYTIVYGDQSMATTVKIQERTKTQLDKFREYKNESYDEIMQKVLYIARTCKTEPELSKETVEAIERARERLKKGRFLTEAEAKKRLGL